MYGNYRISILCHDLDIPQTVAVIRVIKHTNKAQHGCIINKNATVEPPGDINDNPFRKYNIPVGFIL